MKTRLNDYAIQAAKPGKKVRKVTDGGGLILEIKPKGPRSGGSRLWRYRYRIDGKENTYALGEYVQAPIAETEAEAQIRRRGGGFTLAEARIERDRCRRLVKQRIHPAKYKRDERERQASENKNTFTAISQEWIEATAVDWSAGHASAVKRVMQEDIYPHIGDAPIKDITTRRLFDVLRKIVQRGAPTIAISARTWIKSVFAYAVDAGLIETNIAELKMAIKAPKTKSHDPLKDIPVFLRKVDAYKGSQQTKIALRLLLILFVRPVELRSAEWSEIEWDAAQWRIPGEKMKNGRDHLLPLSTQAVELLRELHALTGQRHYLFPNTRRAKAFMAATTLNAALTRMGYSGEFSAHGFRATASTSLNESGLFESDWIERQLAHVERNRTRAAYNAAQYLEHRRRMMQWWADKVLGPTTGNNVLPIRAA
jgi:integrase